MSIHTLPGPAEFRRLFRAVLGPESGFLWVIVIYSAAISLLTLAIPISVQLLIDTVANTGLISAVVSLGIVLFILLMLSGLLYALRAWCMELFNRRLLTRLTSEIAMVGMMAPPGWFETGGRKALFNRFFDIMTVKKNTPYLLSQGFTLLFQSLIGFLVVSLYHPYFLVFSLVLLGLIWCVWLFWGWRATVAGFRLSEAKHETAAWLQAMSDNLDFFRMDRLQDFALARTDSYIYSHLHQQKRHFRFSFTQLLCLLFLYALASAVMLTMGGWLVLQGQMTLGQLVSAELIMSAIFYGLPQLAGYFDYYYDLCAAVEELSRFNHVDSETRDGEKMQQWQDDAELVAGQLVCRDRGEKYTFDFSIAPGSLVRLQAAGENCADLLGKVLLRETPTESGTIYQGDLDLLGGNPVQLRDQVAVMQNIQLLAMPVRDYLMLADPTVTEGGMRKLLDSMDLSEILLGLPDGLGTVLADNGEPLQTSERIRLKLAFIDLLKPKVVILEPDFDRLEAGFRQHFLDRCREQGITVFYGGSADMPAYGRELVVSREHCNTGAQV